MTVEAALRLAAALEAAKSALETDYPELKTELGHVFRGNELANLTDKVKFYSGAECFASPARKAAGLAEAIVGLQSLKSRVESFDGEKILAVDAARQATVNARERARQAALDAERAARFGRYEAARVAYNAAVEELGRLVSALDGYSMEDALRDGPEASVAYCNELKADIKAAQAKRDHALAECEANKAPAR